MKTNLFVATALLFSTVSFAQEAQVKNQQSGTVSAATSKTGSNADAAASSSSSAAVTTNTVNTAEAKAKQAEQAAKKEAAKAKAKTETTVNKTNENIQENSRGEASVSAEAGVNTQSKNNKISRDASLNSQGNLSANAGTNDAKALSQKTQVELSAKSTETVQATNNMKTEIKSDLGKTTAKTKTAVKQTNAAVVSGAQAGSSAAVKTGATLHHTAKPKPAAIKMQSHVKGNAGIKIK